MPDNALSLTASAMPQLSGPGSSEHSLPQAQGWEVGSLGGHGTSPKTQDPDAHSYISHRTRIPHRQKTQGPLGETFRRPLNKTSTAVTNAVQEIE